MSLLSFKNIQKKYPNAKYEKRLDEYREALEKYKNCIKDYSGRLEGFDKRSIDSQLNMMQTSLDLTYIKEQNEVILDWLQKNKEEQESNIITQLDHILATIIETNYKLEGIDKDLVVRITEALNERQRQILHQYKQVQLETNEKLDRMSKSMKSGKILLWLLFLIQLISIGGITYLVLDRLDILPFL